MTAAEAIGGTSGEGVLARARAVEAAVYEVVGALVAPQETDLTRVVTGAYRPFDVIDRIQINPSEGQGLLLLPLVILDDANVLHPSQFRSLEHWLARRELRIARWMIARFDILLPQEALTAVTEDRSDRADFPGLTASRDVEVVLLQSSGPRRDQRTAFRRMAKDMAGRYLQKDPLLGPRRLVVLSDLLGDQEELIAPSSIRELSESVDASQRRLKVADPRRTAFEEEVDAFRVGGRPVAQARPPPGERVISVLLHRYDRRRKEGATLFDADPEPSRPIVANPGVYEAARLHLLHRFGRPFYFGIDDLCDSSSENAELFLQLSAVLVDAVETQVIRSKGPQLSAGTQHRLLRQRAEWIIGRWNFPLSSRRSAGWSVRLAKEVRRGYPGAERQFGSPRTRTELPKRSSRRSPRDAPRLGPANPVRRGVQRGPCSWCPNYKQGEAGTDSGACSSWAAW